MFGNHSVSDANSTEAVLRNALGTYTPGFPLAMRDKVKLMDLFRNHSVSSLTETIDDICREERITSSKKTAFISALREIEFNEKAQQNIPQYHSHPGAAGKTSCILLPSKQAEESISK